MNWVNWAALSGCGWLWINLWLPVGTVINKMNQGQTDSPWKQVKWVTLKFLHGATREPFVCHKRLTSSPKFSPWPQLILPSFLASAEWTFLGATWVMHDIAAHVCVWGLMSNPAWTEAGGEPLKPSLSGVGKYWSTDRTKHTVNANLMPVKAQRSELVTLVKIRLYDVDLVPFRVSHLNVSVK